MPRTSIVATVENAAWGCLRLFPALRAVGVAVSGGHDSMCLLSAVQALSKKHDFSVRVLTINHNMRPAVQSRADCDAVATFCEAFGIPCHIAEIEPGKVAACACKRGRGVEEAARYLRYRLFSEYIRENALDAFCTGHTADDQLETLLQRFLQGSSSFAGIVPRRGIFARPLLNILRTEVLQYVQEMGLPVRIDETNADTSYFRNRIRNVLVPVLDNNFLGWRNGLLNGAKKRSEDASFIEKNLSVLNWKVTDTQTVELSETEYDPLHPALKRRALFHALELLGCEARIPYRFVLPFIESGVAVTGYGYEISRRNGKILTKKTKNYRNVSNFFAIIEKTGTIFVSAFSADISIEPKNGVPDDCIAVGPFELPFIVRSPALSDAVKTDDGRYRALASIFGNWKIPAAERSQVPVIERCGEILCFCGETVGKKNWYAAGLPQRAGNSAYIYFNRGTYVK